MNTSNILMPNSLDSSVLSKLQNIPSLSVKNILK